MILEKPVIANQLTLPRTKTIIRRLARTFQVKVQFESDNLTPNHAACAGREIYFGIFDTPELMLAAFLHELGHIKCTSPLKQKVWESKLVNELRCWSIAHELAWKYRIVISDEAWAWGTTQALNSSYYLDNEKGKTVRRKRNQMFKKLENLSGFFRTGNFLKEGPQ